MTVLQQSSTIGLTVLPTAMAVMVPFPDGIDKAPCDAMVLRAFLIAHQH